VPGGRQLPELNAFLGDKREGHQNCSLLYCVATVVHTHELFLRVY